MGRRHVLLADGPVSSLDDHIAAGGGEGLRLATGFGPQGVIDELRISGLRGRGGAGFPVWMKWESILDGGDDVGERFVVANGAEGEPGTFKDRFLLRHNPYLLVEGVLIAATTVGARRAYIALKASFESEVAAVQQAVAEVAAAGWAPDVQITLVAGPDHYLFGEEKALLEVIEGEDPLPRLFPPYLYGLFTTSPQVGWSAGRTVADAAPAGSNPTLVNNVETLSTVPIVMRRSGQWYRELGTSESPGTILCTVSGDTVRHGVDEFELGTPVAEIIDTVGGGVAGGRDATLVLSGVSNPALDGARLSTPASYEALDAVGAGLGSAGFMVYDDRTDPIELAAAVSRFLWVESCGQCPACKLGTGAVTGLLDEASAAGVIELSVVSARLSTVDDAARCYLPTQHKRVISSLLARIGDVRGEARGLEITKIVDLVDDRFVLDDTQRTKRPDWTYREA